MGCGVVTEFIKTHPMASPGELDDISTDYGGAGVMVKQVQIPAGFQVVQHKHRYPHLSILQYGRVKVITDEWTKELEGPDSIVISSGINHMIIAHTDSMWLCVHAGNSFQYEL